jgi:hypothetical protein
LNRGTFQTPSEAPGPEQPGSNEAKTTGQYDHGRGHNEQQHKLPAEQRAETAAMSRRNAAEKNIKTNREKSDAPFVSLLG